MKSPLWDFSKLKVPKMGVFASGCFRGEEGEGEGRREGRLGDGQNAREGIGKPT